MKVPAQIKDVLDVLWMVAITALVVVLYLLVLGSAIGYLIVQVVLMCRGEW